MEYARTPLLSNFQRSETSEVLNRIGSLEVEDKRSASSESLSSEGDNQSDVSSWKSRPRANTANSSEDSRTLHSTHLTSPQSANRPPRPVIGRPKDTHSFDTTLLYGDLSAPPVPIPTRIPLATFPGEVGDVSTILRLVLSATDWVRLAVFTHQARASLFEPRSARDDRTDALPSAHERPLHSPDRPPLQRSHHAQASALPRSWSSGRGRGQLCSRRLRSRERLRIGLERIHRPSVSVHESHQSRQSPNDVSLSYQSILMSC